QKGVALLRRPDGLATPAAYESVCIHRGGNSSRSLSVSSFDRFLYYPGVGPEADTTRSPSTVGTAPGASLDCPGDIVCIGRRDSRPDRSLVERPLALSSRICGRPEQ